MNCKLVTFSGFSEDNGLNNLGDLNFGLIATFIIMLNNSSNLVVICSRLLNSAK